MALWVLELRDISMLLELRLAGCGRGRGGDEAEPGRASVLCLTRVEAELWEADFMAGEELGRLRDMCGGIAPTDGSLGPGDGFLEHK